MTKRERVKDLSNKAEGIYYYIGPQYMLFRLINTGNELASEINHAVAYFTSFAQNGVLYDDGAGGSRSVIDCIYRKVGHLMCDIDIIHAAGGAEIMPEPFESIDRCYIVLSTQRCCAKRLLRDCQTITKDPSRTRTRSI